MIRQAAAAERFYTGNPIILREEIKTYVTNAEPRPAIAVVSPHAGYPYSGKTAGAALSEVVIPETVVILGPNHWGVGAPYAIMTEGSWEMPFGNVQIDDGLALTILDNCKLLEDDPSAHEREHSLEVQVPFLQHFRPDVKIVPITINSNDLKKLKQLGNAIAQGIKKTNSDALILASTDMSHTHNSSDSLQKKIKAVDNQTLEYVTQLDEEGFLNVVNEKGVTMCGYAAVAAAIAASKKLGAKKGTLVRYSTSYDISGEYNYVVGYAGVVIE